MTATFPFQEQKLTTVHDVVDIAVSHQFWLFRGHPEEIGDQTLSPKVFRSGLQSKLGMLRKQSQWGYQSLDELSYEQEIVSDFKGYAPAVYGACPQKASHVEWLALMQHFGAPTRLLDWSQSALVATYFACQETNCRGHSVNKCELGVQARNDGEVWVVDAASLTDAGRSEYKSRDKGFVTKAVELLAMQACIDQRGWEENECRDLDCCRYPLPFAPPLRFPRIVNQLGWFTIHPRPGKNNNATIQGVFSENKKTGLKRFRVPREYKAKLRDGLAALGVTGRMLFPELGGLADTLESEYERKWKNLRLYGAERDPSQGL